MTESGNVYEGDKIILAAGYESRFIASTVGIDVPMQPVLLETLVTEQSLPCSGRCLALRMRISTGIRRNTVRLSLV